MAVLSPNQLETYNRDGYLVVSGLIPEYVASAAEQAMWLAMGLSPYDPGAWAAREKGHVGYQDPALLACYTEQFLGAAAEVAGDDPATFRKPGRAYSINIFPQEGPWRWPGPHIDHAIKEHGHHTFPRAFRVA